LKSYQSKNKVHLAVDCIIIGFSEDKLELLCIKRDFEPFLGQWSLMGGFMTHEETLDEAAKRVLKKLTGLDDIYMEQLPVFSTIDRDPVERTVSVPYFALINSKDFKDKLIDKYSAHWFSIEELPNLIFDHSQMVATAIKRLRARTTTKPIGFELLPERFTMLQLQSLYEAILDRKLDKRNFNTKVMAMDILFRLPEKETNTSKKGSYLYRFDKEAYIQKMEEGLRFKLDFNTI
jgi:8-oxo-dGTP diphosphatase